MPIDEEFSAGRFAELAHPEIDGLLPRAGSIVVGGTGLYLRAALTELDLRPPPDRTCARSSSRSWPGGARIAARRLSAAGGAAVHPTIASASCARSSWS